MFVTKMISKTLTAGVLCTSLALTSIAPTQAQAEISEGDAIVGMITLLLLGAAIHNSNDRDDPPARTHTRPTRSHPAPAANVLPRSCLRQGRTARGRDVQVYGRQCLIDNYGSIRRLPLTCVVRYGTRAGNNRRGFREPCMRNEGFRPSRH